uniref:Uncharacterized protein n=1 Tax=Bosea sp. NBC_00436 TaxID=2969620 RepID=A0A9E8CLN4_9HYPH
MHHMLRCAITLRNHIAAQNPFFPALALSSSFATMLASHAAHRGETMPGLLKMVGLPDMPMLSVVLVITMIVLGAMMFGWFADLLLGDGGFGVMINTGILLVGAFTGAWLWHRYGIPTRFQAEAVRAAIATGSGLLLLITLAVIRP